MLLFVRFEIDFVKVSDAAEARDYGIDNLPSVLYFENKIPSLYDEDLVQFLIFVHFQFYNKLTFGILGLINKIIGSNFKQLLTCYITQNLYTDLQWEQIVTVRAKNDGTFGV